MAFSINVNAPALSALRNLTGTNRDLAETQERINTGLAINSASDNAAIFSIAQQLRSDLRGLNAVTQSLNRGISSVDVALAASEAISDLLLELNERAVAAADAGLDSVSRQALNADFESLRGQIGSIIVNAEFNGTNLIDNGTDAVQAITSSDAQQVLSVAHQDMTLGQSILIFSAGATISTAAVASSVVQQIQTSIINLNNALTQLGAGASALEQSSIFNDELADVIEVGIGNLVDADLAEESASLQALQVQQQLGIQALSIANSSPQTILSLFNG